MLRVPVATPWLVLSRIAIFVVWMLEGAIFTFALFPCLITRDFCGCRCFAIFDTLESSCHSHSDACPSVRQFDCLSRKTLLECAMRPISRSKLLPRIPNATWIAGLFCLVSQAAEPEERASANAWRMEDPGARAGMPLYRVIPAARDHALTPASTNEINSKFSTGDWHRSHGGHANQRFSPLDQIHRGNVAQLERAWIYHSKDGAGNIQCNPIAVDGLIYAPTVGGAIVAIDGATGSERWRYQCDQRPAFRGLTYWKSDTLKQPRLLFNAGDWLYALDADSGPVSYTHLTLPTICSV